MSRPPLITRFADRVKLSPEEARSRLFYECVPNWKRGFVRFHGALRPRLYQHDWGLVEEAGKATNYQGVVDALDRWNHRTSTVQCYVRNRWQWRISGRRLLALAVALFKDEESEPQVPVPPAPAGAVRDRPRHSSTAPGVLVVAVPAVPKVDGDELIRSQG